jgi:hypothetical protein
VVDFFSPHAAGKDAIFVTALGRSVKSSLPSGERVVWRAEAQDEAPS